MREAQEKDIWYIAHPVSGTPEEVVANIDNAIAWTKWLTDNIPERIYTAPWLGQVIAYQRTGAPISKAFYDRCIEDDCRMVQRYDGVFLCGGRMGAGMVAEMKAAYAAYEEVDDWSELRHPPASPQETAALRDMILSGLHVSVG